MKEIEIKNVKEIDSEILQILGQQGEVSNWRDEYFVSVFGEQNGSDVMLPCGCKFRHSPGKSSISLISACAKHIVRRAEEIAIKKDTGDLISEIRKGNQRLIIAPARQMGV